MSNILKNGNEKEKYLDSIRGSLFGGAVGDALGYPIEFMSEDKIFSIYGRQGIQEYALDRSSGKALISDDTQMSLFTADGILVADAWGDLSSASHAYAAKAYMDWLITQEQSFGQFQDQPQRLKKESISWLLDVPELYSRRAPGMTCISALSRKKSGSVFGSIDNPLNDSKGCGGIMRVAPLALRHGNRDSLDSLDKEGAKIAAITHGHPLGYMSASALVHIISRIVYPRQQMSLKEIVLEARDAMARVFAGEPYLDALVRLIDLAVALSENHDDDLANIHQLGEGWVAEETLAISIYCSLRYQNNFSAGITAAVNHKGDSDSTGAVTGNILGALCGYSAIEEKWKENLELSDVILEMADDLFYVCHADEYGDYEYDNWICKYMKMRRKPDLVKEAPQTQFIAVKGDITKNHNVTAIVNAANTSLLGGGGVDGAIHRAAGPELLEECRHLSGCETGKAKMTKAYKLPCDYVIHTPGPVWRGGQKKERERLASCYRSCLELAVKNGIRSIAFPSISTGIYGFPIDEAAKIAVETSKTFVSEHHGELDVIKWVLFDDITLAAYKDAIEK